MKTTLFTLLFAFVAGHSGLAQIGIGTPSPQAELHVKRTETTTTNGVNIHGIRTDVTVSGSGSFSDDVNGYWANVKSNKGISVNGVFVHSMHTGNNSFVSPLMTLVSGTYGEAEVQKSTSAYNAVGAAGMAESTQLGSNTGLNGVGRNAGKTNVGVNAIANLSDLEIGLAFASKLSSGFSAGLVAANNQTGTNDFSVYSEGSKNYFEMPVGIGTQNPQRSLHVSEAVRLEPLASVPSSPSTGDMYMDDGSNTSNGQPKLRVYDGAAWQECW